MRGLVGAFMVLLPFDNFEAPATTPLTRFGLSRMEEAASSSVIFSTNSLAVRLLTSPSV